MENKQTTKSMFEIKKQLPKERSFSISFARSEADAYAFVCAQADKAKISRSAAMKQMIEYCMKQNNEKP